MPLRLLPVSVFLLATVGVSCAGVMPPHPAVSPPRPVILVVHGRGHGDRDSVEVRRSAQAALSEGLAAYGAAAKALLRDGDVRLVWYADVAAPDAPADAACGRDVDAGAERPGLDGFAAVVGTLLDVVGGLGEAPELRNLRDDVRYVADRRVQCAAEQRLHAQALRAAREGRPAIVVAHSMGALVSWGYFRNRELTPAGSLPTVASFVTVGSPLGAASVREIVFGTAGSTESLPEGVRRWVNVMDADDPFAAPIAGEAMPAGNGRKVDTWTTSRRGDPHLLEGYLRDPGGAGAVLNAWCGALAQVPAQLAGACAAAALP